MSRSMMPSQTQLAKLVDMLEENKFLATGHARTAHARDRTRTAWQKIADTLNSEGNGCVKTWQQWAKYWKDKKAALKKKVSQLHQARQHAGDEAEETNLTAVEERLLDIVGHSFALGDQELENQPDDLEPTPQQTTPLVGSHSPASLLEFTIPAEADSMNQSQRPVHTNSSQHATETLGQRRHATSATSIPLRSRLRRMAQVRQRLLQRTRPGQRSSQMASLTERFIAIKERRVEVEMMQAQTMEDMAQSFDRISQGFLQQSQALQSLAESIRIILERNQM